MMKFLIAVIALMLSTLFVSATAPYVPQDVHDGQCYTVNGNIPAPATFCGVSIVEASVEQVWSAGSQTKSEAASSSGSPTDVILGSPNRESNDPEQVRAFATKATVLDLPNGDHLWAAIEYVWKKYQLLLPYDCELESAFVSVSEIKAVVDRMYVAVGGDIELLPRDVALGEDYVAIGADGNGAVMLAVDAGSWHSSLVLFSCERSRS